MCAATWLVASSAWAEIGVQDAQLARARALWSRLLEIDPALGAERVALAPSNTMSPLTAREELVLDKEGVLVENPPPGATIDLWSLEGSAFFDRATGFPTMISQKQLKSTGERGIPEDLLPLTKEVLERRAEALVRMTLQPEYGAQVFRVHQPINGVQRFDVVPTYRGAWYGSDIQVELDVWSAQLVRWFAIGSNIAAQPLLENQFDLESAQSPASSSHCRQRGIAAWTTLGKTGRSYTVGGQFVWAVPRWSESLNEMTAKHRANAAQGRSQLFYVVQINTVQGNVAHFGRMYVDAQTGAPTAFLSTPLDLRMMLGRIPTPKPFTLEGPVRLIHAGGEASLPALVPAERPASPEGPTVMLETAERTVAATLDRATGRLVLEDQCYQLAPELASSILTAQTTVFGAKSQEAGPQG